MLPFAKPSTSIQSVKLLRPEIDLKMGLAKSPILPWTPIEVDSSKAMESLRAEAPIDGEEIVEWMHYAAADNSVFDAMAEEYNRLGSELLSGSTDAYIPNRRVGGLRGVSVRGSTVRSQGYGEVYTPEGRFRVPVGGKATFAKGNILAWAAIPWAGAIQWVLTLLQWRELASAPITSRVRFGGSQGKVAPNFFSVSTRLPVPIMTLRIGLTSDRPQAIRVTGRGTKGSFEDVLYREEFNIDKGQSEIIYNVYGFPAVAPHTLEIQPADNTKTVLDYLYVYP